MATNDAINTPSPLNVPNGGTSVSTMTTAYAPVCSGTTAAGALQVAGTGLSTSGFVLTSNGASALPGFETIGASSAGLVLIATATASNSAAIQFNNNLTSTYNNYLVIFENVVAVTTGTTFGCYYGYGATPTYITSGYGGAGLAYSSAGAGVAASATTYMDISAAAQNKPICGYIYYQDVNAGVAYMISSNLYIGSPSGLIAEKFSFQTASSVMTSIEFFYTSGNISTGTFRLYGYN
jgi:hypothetical protein